MFNIINEISLTEKQKCEKITTLATQNPDAIFKLDLELTPLHLAVLKNLPIVAKLLLKLGSDVNAVESSGQTALHFAAENGFSDLILVLGFNNPDFNILDKSHETALHKAIKYNHPLCVANLLLVSQCTVDIMLRDKDGNTAEDLIRKKSNIKDQALLAKAFAQMPDLFGRTLLHLAVIEKSISTVLSLLNLNAPVNAKDCNGQTALHLAAICDHSPILLLLTKQDGIDMDAIDDNGNTPLHLSALKRHKDCIEILVTAMNPADKKIKNKAGLTAVNILNTIHNEHTIALNAAFSKTPIANSKTEDFEKELFTFYENTSSNYMTYLDTHSHLKVLSLSIIHLKDNAKSPRKLSSSGSSAKLFTRTNSVLKRKTSIEPSPRENNTNNKEIHIENTMDATNFKIEAFAIINTLKTTTNDLHPSHLQELVKCIQTHRNEHFDYVLRTVIYELQSILNTKQNGFDKERSNIRSILQSNLIANGLKPMCMIQEITQVTKKELSKITDDNETIKHLQLLVQICSGKEDDAKKVQINLNDAMHKCLGMMEIIQPDRIVSLLIQLHPYFSKIQRLQSDYLVITLLELCDSFGYDDRNALISEQVEIYMNKFCDMEIIDCVSQYIRDFQTFHAKSFHTAIAQIKSLLFDDKKESIFDKIHEVVELKTLNLNDNKIVQDNVDYIAKEFHAINAQFYQSYPFNQFLLASWDGKNNHEFAIKLKEYKDIINKMMLFVQNTVASYKTPSQIARAITLFTLVARECLHFQYGPDFGALFAIALSLEAIMVYCSKDILDINTLNIQNALFSITNLDDNYKCYREFLMTGQGALPYSGVVFKDKTFFSEQPELHACVAAMGKLSNSLILTQKNIRDASFVAQSDLLTQLKAQEENPNALSSLRKEDHSLSREPSPRIELSPPTQENSPRKEFSIFKSRSIKRKTPSQSKRLSPLFSSDSNSSSHEEKTGSHSKST